VVERSSLLNCRTFNEVPKVRILHHPNCAALAQLVEWLPCKHPVVRSNRTGGYVTVAEWFMRQFVELVYVGSNPIGHPFLTGLKKFRLRSKPEVEYVITGGGTRQVHSFLPKYSSWY
jgi:hypothetical protein